MDMSKEETSEFAFSKEIQLGLVSTTWFIATKMSSLSTHIAHSISVFSLHYDIYVLSVSIDSMVCVSMECISKSITEFPVSMINFSPCQLSYSHTSTAGSGWIILHTSCDVVMWCQHTVTVYFTFSSKPPCSLASLDISINLWEQNIP